MALSKHSGLQTINLSRTCVVMLVEEWGMRGRGDAGAGHAREALAARLKMRDAGWLGDCLVAAIDCFDVQVVKLETLDARSWRRRSRSTRACRRLTS